MTRLLLAGLSTDLLDALAVLLPEQSIVVLEEEGVFARRKLDHVRDNPVLRSIVFADYIQSDAYLDPLLALHAREPFDAVVPGTEYAVPAAADLAERFGLPGAGRAAALRFRDKILLREAAERGGLLNPQWTDAANRDAARRIAAGSPHGYVVKPADRAGSYGVRVVTDGSDVAAHLDALLAEPPDPMSCERPLRHRYLVEERLVGAEFSVEMLVHAGEPRFTNVTRKHLWPGECPVERGHDVPAPLPEPEQAALRAAMAALITATGFQTGILHGEWIVTERGPALIECAARAPGDRLIDMLDLAYGISTVGLLVDLLLDRPVSVPDRPVAAAAIRFFHAAPGRVARVGGVDRARAVDGVRELVLTAEPGTEIGPLTSSWDRIGFVLVCRDDITQAVETVERVERTVEVVTQPHGVTEAVPI